MSSRRTRYAVSAALIGLIFVLSHSCGGPIVGAPCEDGLTACSDGCVDLDTNESSCGKCQNACAAGETCLKGQCGVCVEGTVECNGECADTSSDENHCGECGNACPPNHLCDNGVCAGCPPGMDACDDSCVDLSSDQENCGECENECKSFEECVEGTCLEQCSPPLVRCGEECVDLTSNPEHCLECDNACPEDNPVCVNGRCEINCPEWMEICDNECVNLDYNPLHCGACNVVCPEDTSACIDGKCVSECPPPLEKCGRECVNLSNDPLHCGDCFEICDVPDVCDEGACVVDCGDKTNCGGACVDVNSDNQHCGNCGNACDANEACVGGECEIKCDGGTVKCDGECVDTTIDRKHCGGCGNSCGPDEVCENGGCIPDCGSLEWCGESCVDLSVDNANCGDCNNSCQDGWFCVKGNCRLDCPDPYTACGSQCVDLDDNPRHCGRCNNPCESGICNDTECREESAGHLIAIGHDLTDSHTTLRRLVGNAVFISQSNPVEVLAYSEFADETSGGHVQKIDSAISTEASAKGRTWNKTDVNESSNITENLLDYDVLLIYTQSDATDSELNAVGNDLYSTLQSFVTVGGIIVFTDAEVTANSGTWRILAAADLFTCSAVYDATGTTANVVIPGDAVAQGLNTTYMATENSVYFSTAEERTVVQEQATGNPLVIHKVFLP